MKRKVLNQVTRYFREAEKFEDFRFTDAAGEGQYLFDDSGNIVGMNILFSCTIEPKSRKKEFT